MHKQNDFGSSVCSGRGRGGGGRRGGGRPGGGHGGVVGGGGGEEGGGVAGGHGDVDVGAGSGQLEGEEWVGEGWGSLADFEEEFSVEGADTAS